MAGAVRITLRLFGRFAATVENGAVRVVQISAPMRRGLLAYLAMQPGYAETRERLATLLWGDRSDKQARQNLRQSLLQLRKEFEPFGAFPLIIDRETLGLDPALVTVDAREFLALARSDDLSDLERAVRLCAGPFLDGVELDTEGFSDWLRAERTRVETAAAGLFEKYAAGQDAAGNGEEAIREAERLVGLDPLGENAQRLLLRMLARHRGREAALGQAQAFTRLLQSELDAEPEPETAALIADIKSGAVATIAPRPAAAPPRRKLAPDEAPPTLDRAPPPFPVTASALAAGALVAKPRPAAGRSAIAAWTAAGAASVALVAVLMLARGTAVRLEPSDARAVATAANPTSDQASWRSPSILSGASAEKAGLTGQGVYAIVVLPFTTVGGGQGPEQQLADRITGDLINDLSRVPALRVIARQTSQLYAGRPTDVAAIGAELGVRYLVEGDVQLQGERMRINVALIDTLSRLQVWSERLERAVEERFAAQDEIARSLARHLHVNVMAAEEERRAAPRSGDPEIDDLLAKGWAGILRFFELGATSGADRYFEEVLKRRPTNGSAMLGLAGYNIGLVAQFLVAEREPYLSRAEALLERILKINPRSSLANYYCGILHKVRGEPNEALAAFAIVLGLNPSFAPAYANAGHVMSRTGRLTEAMEHVRYAIRLSPKDPTLGNWSLYAGEIELERGNDDAALEWFKRSVEINPRSPFNHAALAAAHALRGDKVAAERHAMLLKDIAPWLTRDRMVERVVGMSTKGAEPHRLLEGLRKAFPAEG